MKKSIFLIKALCICIAGLLVVSCIYDPPEPEIRPTNSLSIVTTAGGVSNAKVNDDGSVTATLGFKSDTGVVVYINEDKTVSGENAEISYEFSYRVGKWKDSSISPKFYVRYGDSKSSFTNYDPSYSEKTNYEDASSTSGTISGKIVLKSSADAIVFATNAYQWKGDSGDEVEVTIKQIVVKE